MGMFSPPYTYYNNPSSKYELIGGAYYVPGTAAYNKAKQLAPIYSQPVVTPTAAAASIIAPYAPKATAPTTFPSYPGGAIGGASVMPGAPGVTGQGAFGLVPQKTNPLWAASQAIGGNVSNLAELTQLGTGTTKLAGDLAAMPFQQNLPGYEGMISEATKGIMENLAGEIDFEKLQQYMAQRGTGSGLAPDSPLNKQRLMQALAQDITQTKALGMQQLNAAIGRTPTGQPFNIAGQQITPGTMQEAQWGANIAGAAPDPTMAAQANLDMLLRAIEAGRAGGMGGMGGYGGGGGIPRLSQPVLSPVSAGYPGFSMPNYPTAPGGWSGKVEQPFYRTQPTAPGSPIDTGGLAESVFDPYNLGGYQYGGGTLDTGGAFDPYSLGGYNYGNVPPDIAQLAAPLMNQGPYEYDYTYQPEP